jgi:sRNA-binding carbon storage regulator CsrA
MFTVVINVLYVLKIGHNLPRTVTSGSTLIDQIFIHIVTLSEDVLRVAFPSPNSFKIQHRNNILTWKQNNFIYEKRRL